MARDEPGPIGINVRVIDKSISISIARERDTHLVSEGLVFAANSHLNKALGKTSPNPILISPQDPIHFEPASITPETRCCDFTAEDTSITAYVLADLNMAALLARVNKLEAEKENHRTEILEAGSSKVVRVSDLPLDQMMTVSAAMELVKMMRSKDAEALEKLSKKVEEHEKLSKKVEEHEKQRKKDLEAAAKEIKRLEKDAEKQMEAAAKEIKRLEKDAEKQMEATAKEIKRLEKDAEKQRKKDLETAAQKFKQIENEKENVKKQFNQLVIEANKSHEENENLKNRLSEHELQQQRHMDYLAEGVNAVTDFITLGDTPALDRVKRRNLLDNAQIRLVHYLGIATEAGYYISSLTFRNALGPSMVLADRRRQLVRMIEEKTDLPEEVARLTQPTHSAALNLLAEYAPQMRIQGNQLVHASSRREWYTGSIDRAIPIDRIALSTLLDLVCGLASA